MKVKIENAVLSDALKIADIEKACFPEEEAASLDSVKQRIEAYPESFLKAVDEDGNIKGFINGAAVNDETISDYMFESTSCHDEGGRFQSVFSLSVHPDFRHNGIAGMLMNELKKRALLAGREGVILTCKENLIGFYERFGFECTGVSQSVHGGAVWYDCILRF